MKVGKNRLAQAIPSSICNPVSYLGAFICWFFIANTTGLDLAEQVGH